MKVFAGLIVAASATTDRIETLSGWQANPDAPHCGCQIIIDPAQYGGYINGTCTLRFPYADQSRYGRTASQDPHFVSVASAYMVGRNSDAGPDGFKFTGFDEVSNPDVLDILVFYEQNDCYNKTIDLDDIADIPQDEQYLIYNTDTDAMCEYVLECEDNGAALPGVHLGNFNYDIARSVQTYTVPIYGLEKYDSATFDILDYYNAPNDCMNPLAHHGHGTASGCSTNVTGCSNTLTFNHDQGHNGLLEYFQFEPVSVINMPSCAVLPEHHNEDYQWNTPSPWNTQEAFASTGGAGPMPNF